MALYSPAYLAVNMNNVSAGKPILNFSDRSNEEKNFVLTCSLPVNITVENAISQNYYSNVTLIQAPFLGVYDLKIYNVSIYINGFVSINQHAVSSRLPIDINSNLLSLDIINLVGLSTNEINSNRLLQTNSVVNDLEAEYTVQLNAFQPYIQYEILNPFYNFAQYSTPFSLPIRHLMSYPVEFRFQHSMNASYINFLLGTGLPPSVYNTDCSHTGNGMLDYEFSVVDNPYHGTNFGAYGSRYVFRDLPNDDLSAKIAEINLLFNFIVQGEIFS